jgi:hypothetical protein
VLPISTYSKDQYTIFRARGDLTKSRKMHESTYRKLEILMSRHCFRVKNSMRSASAFATAAAASSCTTFSLSSVVLATCSPPPSCVFAFLRNRGNSKSLIAISDVVEKWDENSSKDRQLRPCDYMLRKACPYRAPGALPRSTCFCGWLVRRVLDPGDLQLGG